MAKNFKEAVKDFHVRTGIDSEIIIEDELVYEIEAEEGDDFQLYVTSDGFYVSQGTPVGVEIDDGKDVVFELYDQYREYSGTL